VSLESVPNRPAIYALHGGAVGKRPVAYVGQAGKLRDRLQQHLVRRDSSVTTGAAVVSLNPDLVRAVEWWEHKRFLEPAALGAAELVAFDVLDPILRSQGRPLASARSLYAEMRFREEFQQLFSGPPSGNLVIETMAGLSARVQSLEARLGTVERELEQMRGRGEGKTP
jgi:hypothetical protein